MFLDFYGFREQPFGVTPDPRFLFFTDSHREALASLYYGIKTERGFIALIADPGMGKTTLLFELLARLRGNARTAFIFHTQCSGRELTRYVATELGITEMHDDLVQLHKQLHDVLVHEANAGRQVVIVIDEAQNLSTEALEAVRLLSDFETPRAKLIQIVLAGQTQLGDTLAMPAALQLRQRIALWRSLKGFTRADVGNYIQHRCRLAGHATGQLFTSEALEMITQRSKGNPRTINHLCFAALSTGFALSKKLIDVEIVGEVLADEDLGRGGYPITSAVHGSPTQRLAEMVSEPRVASDVSERRKRISDRRKPWTSRSKSIERRAGMDRRLTGEFAALEEVRPVAEAKPTLLPNTIAQPALAQPPSNSPAARTGGQAKFKNPAAYKRDEASAAATPQREVGEAQYLMAKRPEERIRTRGPIDINQERNKPASEVSVVESAEGGQQVKSVIKWLTRK